jgi:hypothetical protein
MPRIYESCVYLKAETSLPEDKEVFMSNQYAVYYACVCVYVVMQTFEPIERFLQNNFFLYQVVFRVTDACVR